MCHIEVIKKRLNLLETEILWMLKEFTEEAIHWWGSAKLHPRAEIISARMTEAAMPTRYTWFNSNPVT